MYTGRGGRGRDLAAKVESERGRGTRRERRDPTRCVCCSVPFQTRTLLVHSLRLHTCTTGSTHHSPLTTDHFALSYRPLLLSPRSPSSLLAFKHARTHARTLARIHTPTLSHPLSFLFVLARFSPALARSPAGSRHLRAILAGVTSSPSSASPSPSHRSAIVDGTLERTPCRSSASTSTSISICTVCTGRGTRPDFSHRSSASLRRRSRLSS